MLKECRTGRQILLVWNNMHLWIMHNKTRTHASMFQAIFLLKMNTDTKPTKNSDFSKTTWSENTVLHAPGGLKAGAGLSWASQYWVLCFNPSSHVYLGLPSLHLHVWAAKRDELIWTPDVWPPARGSSILMILLRAVREGGQGSGDGSRWVNIFVTAYKSERSGAQNAVPPHEIKTAS